MLLQALSPARGADSCRAGGDTGVWGALWGSREPFSCSCTSPCPEPCTALPGAPLVRAASPVQNSELFRNTLPWAPHLSTVQIQITQLSPDMKADVLEATYLGKSCVNLTLCIGILREGLWQISSLSQLHPGTQSTDCLVLPHLSTLKLCIQERRLKQIPQK